MGKGARNRADRDEAGRETTVFEAMVSASSGKPFVQMTCALDGEPVFAVKMSPDVTTALGLRAIQAAIEGERDAGFIAFLRSMGCGNAEVGGMLIGLREHRQQFDADAGSMRPLSGDDPSSLTSE